MNLCTKVDEVRVNSLEESGSVTPGPGEDAEIVQIECEVVEEIGRSKRKRVPRCEADSLTQNRYSIV